MIPRHIKIGLAVLGVVTVMTLGSFVDVVGRIRSVVSTPESDDNPFENKGEPLYSPTDPSVPIRLFFPSRTGSALLLGEDSTIFQSADVANRAKQILGKLFEGPVSPASLAATPKDTKVQEIFLSPTGTAYVDLSNHISANHPGGVRSEQATIFAIVNSLTYNLPEVKEVKILVGGVEKETLAGHCLLLLPFELDMTLTDTPDRSPRNNGEPQ